MITRIIIEHFKSIEYCDLTLGPVNIFVGPNGSGKSNIVDAISFLKDAIEHGLDYAFRERLGFESVRHWPPEINNRLGISVHSEYDNLYFSYDLKVAGLHGGFFVEEENLHIEHRGEGDKKPEGVYSVFRSGNRVRRKETGTLAKNIKGDEVLKLDIDSGDIIFRKISLLRFGVHREAVPNALELVLGGFNIFSVFPNTLRQPQKYHMPETLMPGGENLYTHLADLSKTPDGRAAIKEINDSLRLLMRDCAGIRIEELGGFLVPLFEVRGTNGDNGSSAPHTFNVAQVSDGTLRALGLLTALYHPNRPGMMALEEPEQMLHPGALAVLAEAIKDSSEKSQIFITTHSPDLLSHFDPESVFAVEMVDGVTKVSGVAQAQVDSVREGLFTLGEMMSMEGIMRNDTGSAPPEAEGDRA